MSEEVSYQPGPWTVQRPDAYNRWRMMSEVFDFEGQTVLDIGCASGWYCRRAVEEGAAGVVGYEQSPTELAMAARFPVPEIEYRNESFSGDSDIGRQFDCVLCLSLVHYHPREEWPKLARKALSYAEEVMFFEVGHVHANGSATADEVEAFLYEAGAAIVERLGVTDRDRMLFACWTDRRRFVARRFQSRPLGPPQNPVTKSRLMSWPCIQKFGGNRWATFNEAAAHALARLVGIRTPPGFVHEVHGKPCWCSVSLGSPLGRDRRYVAGDFDPCDWARAVLFNAWICNQDFITDKHGGNKGVALVDGKMVLFDFGAAISGYASYEGRLPFPDNEYECDPHVAQRAYRSMGLCHIGQEKLSWALRYCGAKWPGQVGLEHAARCLHDRIMELPYMGPWAWRTEGERE